MVRGRTRLRSSLTLQCVPWKAGAAIMPNLLKQASETIWSLTPSVLPFVKTPPRKKTFVRRNRPSRLDQIQIQKALHPVNCPQTQLKMLRGPLSRLHKFANRKWWLQTNRNLRRKTKTSRKRLFVSTARNGLIFSNYFRNLRQMDTQAFVKNRLQIDMNWSQRTILRKFRGKKKEKMRLLRTILREFRGPLFAD